MKTQFLCLTVLLLLCLSIPLGATAAVTIVSGNNQTGPVGEDLAQPFVIRVTFERSGNPAPGVRITFRVPQGGGSLSTTSATTDDDGRAQTTLTLGDTPGLNKVEAFLTRDGPVVATFRATATVFPDANLRAAIEAKLGKEKNDPITEAEIGSFFTLSANDAEISNLSGLEYAVRLLSLSLKDNEISNLSPLSGLQLIIVYLSGNDITSISALSRMIQIRRLYLDNNRITSLSSLPNLGKASILSFQNNRITDISPLLNDDLGFEGSGRDVYLDGNPLSDTSINTHIPALEARSITVHFSAPTVNIPDANLRAVIEAELGKEKNDPITEAEIRSITRLVGTDAEISSLSGLEHATSLEVLHLQHNEISSLSPLSGLTSLTFLDVEGNEISSLSPLSGLTSLEVLDLQHNEISSLSPLSGLTSLTFLDLQHNEISSLSPLSGLTQLTVVLLSGNNITSISALSRIKNIIKLSLANNRITSLSSLPNLGSVYELSLQDNRITDISPLLNDDLGFRGGNFRNVYLDGNPLSDTSINTHIPALEARSITVHFSAAPTVNIPDANLRAVIEAELGKEKNDPITEAEIRSITRLVGTDAEISSLSGLEHATSLEVLHLQHNEISSLSPLSGLTSLTFLDVEGNEISSLSPLSGLTSLEVLDLEGNEISSLSPLSGLTSLTFLDLQHNEISSLSPLSGLTQLTVVLLSGNNITSISALSRIKNIIKLSLANNRITSLSSLPNLGSVYELSLQDNRITDISPLLNDDLGFRGGNFRNVYLDGNPLSDTSINTHIPALEARSITVHFSAPTVNIPDANLRAAIEAKLGKEKNDPITEAEIRSFRTLSANDAEISNLSGLEYATRLLILSLKDNEISSLSPLSGLQLRVVYLSGNDITSISALSRMIQIDTLYLDNNRITSLSSLPNLGRASSLSFQDNRITDISPLLNDDLGFEGSALGGRGRDVYLDGNPLSDTSINTHIPALEARSITVHFSVTDPPKTELNYISGDVQTGEAGNALAEAFIVEVKIEDEAAANVDVTFMVTSGGGSMDLETVTTDSSGLASSTLTLGPNAGTNTVDVATDTVPGKTVTFTATATEPTLEPVEKPVFTGFPYNFSIPENSPIGTPVGTVSATVSDGDVEYELHDGDDNDSFRIGRDTGQLTSAETFNYEEQRSYSLGIRATGPSGSEDTVATVTITEMEDEIPPNAAPTFSDEIATFTVPSDASVGTVVGTVTATDADNDTLTYSLSGSSSFAINTSTGVLTTDAELTESTHDVTVTVDDGKGGTATIAVTITVTPQGTNNPPTFPSTSPTFTVSSDASVGTVVGTVTATDANNDTLTYGLSGPDSSSFAISSTGVLRTVAVLTEGTYRVTVTANDDNGGSDSIQVTINITRADDTDRDEDSNTAPTFNDGASTTRSITENVAVGTAIGPPVAATDPDSGDTVTHTLSGADAAAFEIDMNTGQLRTKAVLDHETQSTYNVMVNVSDGTLADTIEVTITVTDINEMPTFDEGASTTRSITENVAVGTAIGPPVAATDPDGDTLTYTLSGADAAAFELDMLTGQLSTVTILNSEAQATYTVMVTASDGTLTATTTVTVTITDLDEFLWSIPQGLSLVHVPLKVTAVDGVAKTLETINDLYHALGGETDVKLLITRGPLGDRWLSYLGDTSRGRPGDRTLTDDLGILVDMKNSVTVELSGDPLGMNGMSAITLREGPNLVGVPLKDSRLTRVSDLFALEGIAGNVSEVLTWVGVAKVITHAGDEDDGPLTGGQSFFLEASEMATVAISGTGWYNSTGINAAPLIAANALRSVGTTPVLAVTGSIAVDAPGGNYRVTVKNLSTGTVNTVTVRDAGDFQLTLVDVVGGVAQIGDILEVTAESSDPSIGVQPLRHIVTAKDVQRSVIQLDALLAYAIPSQTELLHNYPNPFNPETWIPYRLASDANVTLTIYDQHGGVVRTLNVGHRPAAVYERRDKAIYWDGKNEFGERVASGIYFYHLSAGDYSATRKMVIVK